MLQRFHNYIRGNVRCVVTGARPERFLNRCVQEGISFWDLVSRDPNCLTLSMSAGDYLHIRPVAHASACSVPRPLGDAIWIFPPSSLTTYKSCKERLLW